MSARQGRNAKLSVGVPLSGQPLDSQLLVFVELNAATLKIELLDYASRGDVGWINLSKHLAHVVSCESQSQQFAHASGGNASALTSR